MQRRLEGTLLRHFSMVLLVAATVSGMPVRADGEINFNRDVRPILSDKCFHCHGPDESAREADLRLDDETVAKADRDGVITIAPGDPAASELIRRVLSDDESEVMPPPETNKPLTKRQINTLRQWIAEGAEWSPHWAYVTPERYAPPKVQRKDWPRGQLDHFILDRLEREGLQPSPEVDRVTLLRRVCFDLTGLPPSPKTALAFLENKTDSAYEQLVEQLLKSPHYGERMATYWLDLVRYADTVGYHGDQTQNIAPYRDWVIAAFNDNLPFDQFTREQLAGDLLTEPTQQQIIATGYNRLLQTTHEGGLQPKEYRAIYAADRVRNFSAVWLGGTMGCSQCHDHKFDPYTMSDFYSLAAFFADVDDESHFKGGTNANPTVRAPELELPTPEQSRRLDELQAELAKHRTELKQEALTEQQKEAVSKRVKKVEADLKAVRSTIRRTMITVALETPRVSRLLPRGNWLDESGEVLQPAIPEFWGRLETADRRANRQDLANWLVDPEHGIGLLTARVMVNRLWYLCFGSGLASDLDDFGGQGEPPVHPELLDHLAHELVDGGWNVRALMKQIVMSNTYRQSSVWREDLAKIDPGNRLYARQSPRRLDAEMIRDNALALSGLLVTEIGGDSSRPYQPAGYYRHLNFPQRKYEQDNDQQQWRRGVYVHWQRQFLHPMLKAFDAPSREECTAQRPQSNTPLAALTLLNDPTFLEAAREFARRGLDRIELTDVQRIKWLFRSAVVRAPVEEELAVIEALLNENRRQFQKHQDDAEKHLAIGLTSAPENMDRVELAAWTAVCRTILNLAETNTRN